jgi:hypothetical protein
MPLQLLNVVEVLCSPGNSLHGNEIIDRSNLDGPSLEFYCNRAGVKPLKVINSRLKEHQVDVSRGGP